MYDPFKNILNSHFIRTEYSANNLFELCKPINSELRAYRHPRFVYIFWHLHTFEICRDVIFHYNNLQKRDSYV